jgi:hypothetical protein
MAAATQTVARRQDITLDDSDTVNMSQAGPCFVNDDLSSATLKQNTILKKLRKSNKFKYFDV